MKVHELLADPTKWTKGTMARKASGLSTYVDDDSAVCWCMLGALLRCYQEGYSEKVERVQEALDGKGSIGSWNDDPDRTHEEIHTLLTDLDL